MARKCKCPCYCGARVEEPRAREVVALYGDGGCVGHNPSYVAGTWAWIAVDGSGVEMARAYGSVTPHDVGLPTVTNNYTELLAILHGLEAMVSGWAGTVYTDSEITMFRFDKERRSKYNGIPASVEARVAAVKARMGPYKLVLLAAHPKQEDLLRGRREDGRPVSRWNKECDKLCQLVCDEIRAKLSV